jgi:REP element-mobilizing transposase RayT
MYHLAVRFPRPIRRPLPHYANRELRFHLTFQAHPEIPAFAPALRDAIWASLMSERQMGRVELFAACLMPDHLHVLLRPDGLDVIRFVNSWKSVSTRISWGFGNHGGLWQPGMWDRTMRTAGDFEKTAEYIASNPVAEGLVEAERQWPWVWAWWFE